MRKSVTPRVLLSIRLPQPLERELRALAERERRTLSEQVTIVCEHGLKVAIILGIVDREEGGREALEKEAPLVSLFRRRDFLPVA